MRGIACCAVAGFAAAVHAQYLPVTPYLSAADSPFAGSFTYFHLETFEDGLLNTPGLSASAGFVLGPGPQTDSVDGDDGLIDGSGTAGHSYYATATSVTFTFSAAALGALPTRAGLVFTDVGTTAGQFGVANVIFEAFDASNNSLGTVQVVLGDGQVTGETAEDRFFGAVNAGGISAIRISIPGSTDWEVDHVQYGLIPAPGAVGVLVGTALCLSRRKRQRP